MPDKPLNTVDQPGHGTTTTHVQPTSGANALDSMPQHVATAHGPVLVKGDNPAPEPQSKIKVHGRPFLLKGNKVSLLVTAPRSEVSPAQVTSAETAAPHVPKAPSGEGEVAATASRDASAIEREASGLSRTTRLGGALAPTVFGAVIEGSVAAAHGKSGKDIAKAAGHGALNGAVGVDDWRTTFKKDPHLTGVDRALAAGRAGTATATTGLAVAAPFTDGATLPIAGVTGIANIGLGVLQDVAHWTGVAHNEGILQQTYEVGRDFDKNVVEPNARAESAMYRAIMPLSAVANSLFHDQGIHGKVSSQMGQAIYQFSNIRSQSSLQRVEEGSAFAKQLAIVLREQGPEGDVIRKSMASALQKAGVTAEQYATALDRYAKELDVADVQIKTAAPGNTIRATQQAADALQNSLDQRPAAVAAQPHPQSTPTQPKDRPNRAGLRQEHTQPAAAQSHTSVPVVASKKSQQKAAPAPEATEP